MDGRDKEGKGTEVYSVTRGESKSKQACHAVALSVGGSHPTTRSNNDFFQGRLANPTPGVDRNMSLYRMLSK